MAATRAASRNSDRYCRVKGCRCPGLLLMLEADVLADTVERRRRGFRAGASVGPASVLVLRIPRITQLLEYLHMRIA